MPGSGRWGRGEIRYSPVPSARWPCISPQGATARIALDARTGKVTPATKTPAPRWDTGLARDEVDAYVTHRLRLAGCELPVFEQAAIEALSRATRGLPRKINRIAHYALSAAALDKARTVNAEHLHNAIDVIRRGNLTPLRG